MVFRYGRGVEYNKAGVNVDGDDDEMVGAA